MSISKQGIWIDCKALLPLSYQLNNVLSNKDRLILGDKLVEANLGMMKTSSDNYIAKGLLDIISSRFMKDYKNIKIKKYKLWQQTETDMQITL